MSTDTIVAIATAAGPGGVGIVRLSGVRAIEIAATLLRVESDSLDRTVRLGWVTNAAGQRVDQVLAFAMRSPASFTGEDVAELQGHGGAVNLQRLLAAAVERGARIAEPGEFTRRAVLNGKLDLLRAEALLGVIHAGSERAWRLSQANLDGRLGTEVGKLEARALVLLAEIEGTIDFPDEDLEAQSAAWVAAELAALRAECQRLADSFGRGRAIASGVVVALVGAVNAGKSSLLNALVGTQRALVADTPGTTRDWLEVATVWHGIAVTLVDTAGLRETSDAVERRGIAMGEERVASADVVLVVDDGRGDAPDVTRFGARAVRVRSKCDLASDAPTGDAIATSALTGAGLELLKRRALEVAGVADAEGSEDAVVTTARQAAQARDASEAFAAALDAWRGQRPPEVVAVDLRHASQLLAQLRGVEVGERVLDELFARFCIGK